MLKADPWEKQQQIAQAVAEKKRVAVRSCHNSGKSFLSAALVPWWLHTHDPALAITTAPTQRQVKDLLWHEIAQHHRRSGLSGTLNTLSLEISPTRRAFGFTTNEPERFQGFHSANILVIVDESSGVSEEIYQSIEGILTGPNAKLLLIGNPNQAQGTFYEAFRSPLYEKFHIQASDVPEHLLPASWAAERLEEWGEDSPAYQVRVLGEFPSQSEDSLIALSWVTAAQERDMEDGLPVEIGVDVARFGTDESVAYVRAGSKIIASEFWRGMDTTVSTGKVAALARTYSPTAIKVDDPGIGGGVTDQLKAQGLPVVAVNVGETALDSENFYLKRTEIFVGLRDRFKSGDISIPKDDSLLVDQLTSLRFSYTPRGQMKLESKEDLRKRRGTAGRWASPDRADALALCYYTNTRPFVMGAWAGGARPR